MLRYAADVKTLLYLVIAVALSWIQWHQEHFNTWLYVLYLLVGVTTAVISHNHNHLGIWKWRPLNLLTSYVLAQYYGHPGIAWVPTHNITHHKLNNRPGDTSRSPKFFKNNHLLALLVYPTLTGIEQTKEIRGFFNKLWRRSKTKWAMGISEYVVWVGVMVLLFWLDWRKAILYFLIPQQFTQFTIQVFNYIQHVECDAYSEWNHSRNFVSPVLNWLLLNNGIHTVHHLKPGVHWSQTPALHAEHVSKIDPALNEKSFWWYIVRTYFIRPFMRRPQTELAS
jgi:fatty acid desaturase